MRDRGEPAVFVRTRPGSPREIEGNRERLRLACESAAGALAGRRGADLLGRWEEGLKRREKNRPVSSYAGLAGFMAETKENPRSPARSRDFAGFIPQLSFLFARA